MPHLANTETGSEERQVADKTVHDTPKTQALDSAETPTGPASPPAAPMTSPLPLGANSSEPTQRILESDARIPLARDLPPPPAADPDAPAQPPRSWIGQRVGPYVVQQKISKGGMGLVLLAYDEALRRQIALKVMDTSLVHDPDALKRFEREARATAAVQHRNIAQVYMVGLSNDGQPFLAMEYIDGGSLMEAIRTRRAMTFSQVATLMEQVASALGAAAKVNVIHRDIKPANIMLTKEMEAKLVDFGLAKIFFEESYHTREGMVLGTPSYMAPEQTQGRVVDLRADIYSLGATFYHLITGRPPFIAESPVQIMMKHVTAPLVPMRSINPAVPLEFDDIIGKCMRKDLDDRYQDYDSLLADIKRLRLQCMSREQGALIGAPTTQGPAPTHAPASVASSLIPEPPGGWKNAPSVAGIGGATTSVRPNSSAVSMAHSTSIDPPQDSGWTPVRIAVIAGSALVILAAIAAAMLTSDSDTGSGSGKGEKGRTLLAIYMEQAAERARQRGEVPSAVDTTAVRYEATMGVLKNLHEGLKNYHVKGGMPEQLSDIANERHVIVNFEVDDVGTPLDGWNNQISYDPESGELRSWGADGQYSTFDDIVFPFTGEPVVPNSYRNLTLTP